MPWSHEDCANEPSPLHCFVEQRRLWALGAKVAVMLLLCVVSLLSQAAVREPDGHALQFIEALRALAEK